MAQSEHASRVTVRVVRSGGIANRRREWRAEPPPDQTAHWIALIDDCPWDDVAPPSRGADRYVWNISARCDDDASERDAELPDSGLHGPWRVLVDEVREASSPRPR